MITKDQVSPLPQGVPDKEGHTKDSGAGKKHGGKFTPEQLAWLEKIKDQIAQNAEMTVDDFNYIPFNQEGGLLKARELFGVDLEDLIERLNCELIA